MNKNILTLIVLITLITSVFGQNNHICGTDMPSDQWETEFQRLIKQNNLFQQKRSSTYTIPIIFHILHTGETVGTFPNIDSAQINSQITVLNEDFNGIGRNVNTYPINAFTNWVIAQGLPTSNIDSDGRVKIGNLDIEFCLAQLDTSGNALTEQGIDRININSKGWTNPNTFTTQTSFKNYLDSVIKPQSIWDVTKYLNIWLSDKSVSLQNMGVSSAPPFTTLTGLPTNNTSDSTDGIWCWAKAVGSFSLYPSGVYKSNNIAGRTLTHEIGHYLGLRHIWGDSPCANDYCDDTPTASASNTGNPSYPLNSGSCPLNSPDGEMFMNFMDYTIDPYKYMFTVDQITRMQTALLNSPFRNQLGTHGICSIPISTTELIDKSPVIVYPNPTNGHFTIERINQYKKVKVTNIIGLVIYEHQIEQENSLLIDLSSQTCGLYIVNLYSNDYSSTVLKLLKK